MPITKEYSKSIFPHDAICFRAWNKKSKRFVVVLYIDFAKYITFKHKTRNNVVQKNSNINLAGLLLFMLHIWLDYTKRYIIMG